MYFCNLCHPKFIATWESINFGSCFCFSWITKANIFFTLNMMVYFFVQTKGKDVLHNIQIN